jgi:hypothetical protein
LSVTKETRGVEEDGKDLEPKDRKTESKARQKGCTSKRESKRIRKS